MKEDLQEIKNTALDEGPRRALLVIALLMGVAGLVTANNFEAGVVMAVVFSVATFALGKAAWWVYKGFKK